MKKERNINIDLVKCIAVFCVLSVHFFLNNGFYDREVIGIRMYTFVFFRTLFMICVPLFLITTGYLMKNKQLNKKYYFGANRVIITYLLAALSYLLYMSWCYDESLGIKYIIGRILKFDVGYSWYIEMYLGLFLLIPFINLIYNNLNTKKQKIILIFTMLLLTSFQGILNIKYYLIPDWWIMIYPLTYYFIGSYIREYNIKINNVMNLFLFGIVIFASSAINVFLSRNGTFVWGMHNDWGSIFNVISSTLIFVFIINLNLKNINKKIKRIIVKISELSLGIYLLSAIVDDFLYFNYYGDIDFLNFSGYFKIVPLVFILSVSLSMIINLLYKIINKYIVVKFKPL